MEKNHVFESRLTYFCWGLLLIWWGLRWSVLSSLPEGSGLLVTSLVFFGANYARRVKGLPTLRDNTFIGLFSLISGGAFLVFDVLDLPYQTSVLETFMISLGVLILGYAIVSTTKRTKEA